MKPKTKQHKPRVDADVAMSDVSRPKRAKKSDKFKDLKIDTQQLKDNAEPEAEKVAPPSSTSKKRRRRPAAEIDRKYKCTVADCTKAYGSEGSLIHHQKVKHPELAQVEAQEKKETQVGTFLLPLHNAPRNVTIRPATPLVKFATDPVLLLSNQSANDTDALASPSDIIPPSAKAPRRNMRSRSNSEPVTLIDAVAAPMVSIAAPSSNPIKNRTRTPRKPRRAATPHPKKPVPTVRRAKIRSKSESLPEMTAPFQPLDELKMPVNRSDSVASAHEAILPITTIDSGGRGSFEWPPASTHHSTSLSSDEQAIDSDILSVLANCDDLEDPSVLDFGGEPVSTSSYQSNTSFEAEDTEMLPVGMECFKISENSTLPTEDPHPFVMNEPEAELGLKAFATLTDDWANALHLSTHLEKMSMAQVDTPPSSLESFGAGEATVGRLRSASDPVHMAVPMHPVGLTHFSSMPVDVFAPKRSLTTGEDLMEQNASFQQWFSVTEPAKTTNNSLWSSEVDIATATDSQPTSAALDELLQHDDAVEWKAANVFEGDTDVDYALADAAIPSTLL
ncbi:hypothetical protein F441_16445 [Phytophthora nicotianae CJ01A1]|uniref:C2H2-type domain-containing protein n=3 Tax=Phytophthora nicotianae TaxID=4792 RepID=W2YK82_PHYNI|nr:hypothetical protein L915_16145 [Phytophthora nicotianae]ETL31044.1 hypothetical protein L916_16043 [Phytophthora nicotianae]ETP07234.1 hypothetical protein F441_16445 [Phytophthora nicotianae CJ01A1]ETP35311.1 hypothetical protein F442_16463 [Phytophthora nicotianae P10297]